MLIKDLFNFSSKKIKYIFWIILLLALFFRLAFISLDPIFGDEPAYTLRNIGYVDTLASNVQTTPIEWFKDLPWWTHLSFHDHPPLTFIINHIFLSFFGTSLVTTRLPSILAGVLSTVLIFLISRKILDEKGGLLAMFLYAVNVFAVFYERPALMEAISNFFILLTVYFFIRALEDKKFLLYWGPTLGLSIISKYLALAVIPVYIFVLFKYKRSYFKEKYLYFSFAMLLAVIMPVIVYNIFMYSTRGHFDLQFSYFFKQTTPEWKVLPGKIQIPNLQERLIGLGRLGLLLSPALLVFFISSLVIYTQNFFKRKKTIVSVPLVLTYGIFFAFMAFTLLSGPMSRFQYYTVPYVCILTAGFLRTIQIRLNNKKFTFFLGLFLAYEFSYTFNNIILTKIYHPIGPAHFFSNQVFNLRDYGVTNLDNFLSSELKGKFPRYPFSTSNKNIDKIVQNYYLKNSLQNKEPYPAVIIYDVRADIRTALWVFMRRMLYEGWPGVYVTEVMRPDSPFIKNLSDKEIVYYFVNVGEFTLRNKDSNIDSGDLLAKILIRNQIEPIVIKNRHNQPTFYIYKFGSKIMQAVLDDRRASSG